MHEKNDEINRAGGGILPYRTIAVFGSTECAGGEIRDSYYFLKEILKKQSPKLVVWDVSALFSGDSVNIQWRFNLDIMPLSATKVELAKLYPEAVRGASVLSGLIPFIQYHSRWEELTSADFSTLKTGRSFTAGYNIASAIAPARKTYQAANDMANYLRTQNTGTIDYYEYGVRGQTALTDPLLTENINERSLEYLLKMKALCEEHGAQFLMIKIPTLQYVNNNDNAWTDYKYILTRAMADEYGIPFYDFTYDTDVGLDYNMDTVDGGAHLNIRGAEKVTQAMLAYLQEHYDIPERSDPQYDEEHPIYEKMENVALLQSEMDFEEYIDLLVQNKENWTILISAKDDYVSGLTPEDHAQLQRLGLELISEGNFGDSYLAIIDRGEVKREAKSARRMDYGTTVNGLAVSMCSAGWYMKPDSAIVINGQSYGMNQRGLNIVVYDNESNMVIDSINFDTWQESKPAVRSNNNGFVFLNNYVRWCYAEYR